MLDKRDMPESEKTVQTTCCRQAEGRDTAAKIALLVQSESIK
jgi:hypothetical protein